ncbi:MAG: ATP-binding cassette domain-containing protein [Candidatus Methanomethylophilaceae archaeon]
MYSEVGEVDSERALELKRVSVVRDGNPILSDVDLSIGDDENVAIIGPNGSGKTTLMKLLRAEILPYYDENNVATMRIFGKEQWDIFDLRSKMGIVSMDLQSRFSDDTEVSEVIMSGYFGSLDVFRNHETSEDMRGKVRNAAMKMGIDDLLGRKIGELSLGEMRRTLIARAMITEPRMLVLDEPMTGLDIVMKDRFRKMFDIMMGSGMRLIMITHELEDIPLSVRRVVMIKDGRIFADGPKEKILTSKKVSELYDYPISVNNDNGVYHMVTRG